MKNLPTVFIIGTLVTGCAPAKETGEFLSESFKDGMHRTVYALQDWTMEPPEKEGEDLFVEDRYCYRVQTDVLCYRNMVPGMEAQLVAYQGTDAMPPHEVRTRLMPKSVLNENYIPENRVKTLTPVVSATIPSEEEKRILDQADQGSLQLTPDMASEILPDPSHSPQL